MKLEVGMYVRTPYGIDKIKDIVLNGNLYEDSGLYLEKGIKLVCGKEEMKNLKTSHNIIDLIEVGDYVNGVEVIEIYEEGNKFKYSSMYSFREKTIEVANDNYETIPNEALFTNEDIKSIVTKENFESMSYKVGD